MFKSAKVYSLNKSKNIFKDSIKRYKKLRKRLTDEKLLELEQRIEELDSALTANDRELASTRAKRLAEFMKSHGQKTWIDHTVELVCALILAVAIAACVRQMWFELYEIPTGSMRPTFRERDRVLVIKNAFGINTPFQTSHLLFQPDRVKHGQIIVFSGDNLDMPEVDTLYFGLFPGKKRYVKRCLGKPGDIFYFYGGKVYLMDSEGTEITEFEGNEAYQQLEHIPFISFDGKVVTDQAHRRGPQIATIRYMNVPIAQVSLTPGALPVGKMLFHGLDGTTPSAFSKILGIENFAQARLIKPKELPQKATDLGYAQADAKLYLELKHHPQLPSIENISLYSAPSQELSLLRGLITWIPMGQQEIDTLISSLTTSRFVVINDIAYRYSQEGTQPNGNGIGLNKQVPNGTYEFIDGIAYHIGWHGLSEALPAAHPLIPKNATDIQVLFNAGIELVGLTNPASRMGSYLFPSRYAYFRDGDFYVLNHKLFDKQSTTLAQFLVHEAQRTQKNSTYIPFIDTGSPMQNGVVDTKRLMRYGMKVPEKSYLALGDNHAMSLDSRFFGYVPEDNMQGTAFVLFWPYGSRFGIVPQPQVSFFRIENLYTFTAAGLVSLLTYLYFRACTSKKRYQKLKKKTKRQ